MGYFESNPEILANLKEVSIPWGYHTVTKKLDFCDGDFYISKQVRKSDCLVTWAIHEKNGKVCTKTGMVMYEASEDSDAREREALRELIRNFEKVCHVEFAKTF